MIVMGIDIGSNQEPTGICLAEEEIRDLQPAASKEATDALEELLTAVDKVTDAEVSRAIEAVRTAELQDEDLPDQEVHFTVRYLEPLPPATPFPAIADRVGQIVARVAERTDESLTLYVNATGKGTPVVDLLKERVGQGRVLTVFFTHGDRRTTERGRITLGKAYLVSRLQTLLQTGRVHLPRTPAAKQLADELADYEVQVEPDANERYGSFPVGSHDELVTALGLAVQIDPPRWGLT